MIEAGFSGILAIGNEKTDHLWIVLTDQASDPLAVLAMLTDARNVENPELVLAAGTNLTPRFKLSKASTIDFARTRKLDWEVLSRIVNGPGFTLRGAVDTSSLRAIRESLLTSPHTPVDVLEYCRGREW